MSFTSCGTLSRWTALSLTTSAVSVVVTVISVPVNGVLILAITLHKRFHHKFYYIMLSIIFADFLQSLVVAPLSAIIHRKEAVYGRLPEIGTHVFRYGVISLGVISILSMALLSVDRMFSLLRPLKYKMFRSKVFVIALSFVWIVTLAFSPIYFEVEFVVFFSSFASASIALTFTVMLCTMHLYKQKIHPRSGSCNNTLGRRPPFQKSSQRSTSEKDDNEIPRKDPQAGLFRMEKRATNSFLLMLCIFLGCYIPVVGMGLYILLCSNCNCLVVHIFRDLIILLVLSSSGLRALNFLIRLTALRTEVGRMLGL